ncbi:MAG TPA: hypothetical protein VLG44_05790 [Chlamydiales bacterium]|nr:hypothetical protein [Chlamydiales bacterium]
MAAVTLSTAKASFPPVSPTPDGDIDAVDKHDRTQLFYASQMGDHAKAEKLLEKGASPFVGDSPFFVAKSNKILLRLLVGADPTKTLRKCRTNHEICDIFFPREKVITKAVYQSIGKKIPYSEALMQFETLKRKYPTKPFDYLQLVEKILSKLDIEIPTDETKKKFLTKWSTVNVLKHIPLEVVQQALADMHPLFKLAWDCTSLPEPISLIEDPDATTTTYCLEMRSIIIGPQASLQNLIENMVFFTLTALIAQGRTHLDNYPIDRESHIMISIFCDYQTLRLAEQFLSYIFPRPPYTKSFEAYWLEYNMPATPGGVSQAEEVRRNWNDYHFYTLLRQQPEVFQAGLDQLEKAQAKN